MILKTTQEKIMFRDETIYQEEIPSISKSNDSHLEAKRHFYFDKESDDAYWEFTFRSTDTTNIENFWKKIALIITSGELCKAEKRRRINNRITLEPEQKSQVVIKIWPGTDDVYDNYRIYTMLLKKTVEENSPIKMNFQSAKFNCNPSHSYDFSEMAWEKIIKTYKNSSPVPVLSEIVNDMTTLVLRVQGNPYATELEKKLAKIILTNQYLAKCNGSYSSAILFAVRKIIPGNHENELAKLRLSYAYQALNFLYNVRSKIPESMISRMSKENQPEEIVKKVLKKRGLGELIKNKVIPPKQNQVHEEYHPSPDSAYGIMNNAIKLANSVKQLDNKPNPLEKMEKSLADYLLKNVSVVKYSRKIWSSGLFGFRTVIPGHELAKFKFVCAYEALKTLREWKPYSREVELGILHSIRQIVAEHCIYGILKYSNSLKTTNSLEAALDITQWVNDKIRPKQKKMAPYIVYRNGRFRRSTHAI
jgi:hypothetical protein